ncbi:toxin-antitoxin system YwqK family antitoxin [Akkermansiaceae bacterium]|nr:toxin-antitoxin system YwqK family antitoxin [Akkermansiaceae bacterium]
MKWLLLSLLSIFLIGCGPDLDDPKELDTIIEEALSEDKIQERGEGDQALFYAPNKQQPYTGWLKAISDSGQVRELVQIKDGKKNGLHAKWSNNGQRVSEEEYKDGKQHGDSTGWHENGQKSFEVEYKDGEIHGENTGWHENGQKSGEVEYKDGEIHGEITAWYENGQKSGEGEYKDGEIHGEITAWYENGQKSGEGEWKNGKLVTVKIWLPDGSDCPDTNVEDGTGTMVTYDKDGKETSREEYKNGIEISE